MMRKLLIFGILSLLLLMSVKSVAAIPPLIAIGVALAVSAGVEITSTLIDRYLRYNVTSTGPLPQWLVNLRDACYDNLHDLLLMNPDICHPLIADLKHYFITLLEPLCVTAILFIALYLIFLSGSPGGRARAKSWFVRLVLGMVLITLSQPILLLLLGLSHGLTSGILALGPVDMIGIHKASIDYMKDKLMIFGRDEPSLGIPFLMFGFLLSIGVVMTLFIRHFVLLLLAILFPVAIFFYLFKPLRPIGTMLLKQVFFWVFLPVGYAIALVVIAIGEQGIIAIIPELADIVHLSGTLLLIISPLVMLGIMNWIALFAISSSLLLEPLTPLIGFLERLEIEE